jgi:hypothetical protein
LTADLRCAAKDDDDVLATTTFVFCAATLDGMILPERARGYTEVERCVRGRSFVDRYAVVRRRVKEDAALF